jgi:hypothetical protein
MTFDATVTQRLLADIENACALEATGTRIDLFFEQEARAPDADKRRRCRRSRSGAPAHRGLGAARIARHFLQIKDDGAMILQRCRGGLLAGAQNSSGAHRARPGVATVGDRAAPAGAAEADLGRAKR